MNQTFNERNPLRESTTVFRDARYRPRDYEPTSPSILLKERVMCGASARFFRPRTQNAEQSKLNVDQPPLQSGFGDYRSEREESNPYLVEVDAGVCLPAGDNILSTFSQAKAAPAQAGSI